MTAGFFNRIFSADGFMPHGHCYSWEPVPFWISVGSDSVITVSYFAIAFLLFLIVKSKPEFRFRGIFFLFSSFILLCGWTHLMAVVTMWEPLYRFDSLLKLATAVVSGTTAVILGLRLNDVRSIPTPSEHKKTQSELRLQSLEKIRAEEESKAKSMFISHMSHELRTPLTSILCALDILSTNGQAEGQQDIIGIARDSSHRLLYLINDALDLSKAEAGELVLLSEPFSPSKLISSVCEMLQLQAKSKGIHIEMELDEATPTILIGDPGRLNQVLVNLVGNAVKFTQKGKVTVRMQLKMVNPDRTELQINVEDTGPGISEEDLNRIFAPFQQAGSVDGTAQRGSGLGLAISKKIVSLMDGTIRVESKEGIGTTFIFQAPFRLADNQNESGFLKSTSEEADMELDKKAKYPMKILLVEDNFSSQQVITRILQNRGHDVEEVFTIAEAVEQFKGNTFNLVVMDIRLGKESGIDCARQLRSLENEPGTTPILAFSAQSSNDDKRAALEAGMDDYLVKPVPARRLIQVIESWGRATKL